MASNTTDKGKDKASAIDAPPKDTPKQASTSSQAEGDTTEEEEATTTITTGETSATRYSESNTTTDTAAQKKTKKRKRSTKKKGKGKAKEEPGSDAGEEQEEEKMPARPLSEAEDATSPLREDFPFPERISALPVEQRLEKLRELQEFMRGLRDRVVGDVERLREQVVLEAAEAFLETLVAVDR